MLPLSKYASVKDYYCICYYGSNAKHLKDLLFVRPYFESQYPGLKVFICCRDDMMYVFDGAERIVAQSEMKDAKYRFGYIREVRGDTSPAAMLAMECGLKDVAITLEKVVHKK